jgi:hypothetical protein
VIVEPIFELSLAFHREGSFVTHEAAQRAFNHIFGRVRGELTHCAHTRPSSSTKASTPYSRSSSFIIPPWFMTLECRTKGKGFHLHNMNTLMAFA